MTHNPTNIIMTQAPAARSLLLPCFMLKDNVREDYVQFANAATIEINDCKQV